MCILISDRRMSELHRRFMGIAGPTDVITFQHGEIFISTETARRQARSIIAPRSRTNCVFISCMVFFICTDSTIGTGGATRMDWVQARILAGEEAKS